MPNKGIDFQMKDRLHWIFRLLVEAMSVVLLAGCTHLPAASMVDLPLPQFQPAPLFDEQIRSQQLADGVRIFFNAPKMIDRSRPTRLIIYALPNGSNIEETLGATLVAGLSARHDIQHIAAQTRVLRKVNDEENIVLVLVEADGKAWPAWRAKRPDNARLIAEIFDGIQKEIATLLPTPLRVSLMAHSGGGSFIWGLMNHAALPASIDRIALLDANYSFDSALQHGSKFLHWLQQSSDRRLIVIAYDDREILYEGKRVIGPTGGTWRASGRMLDDFGRHLTLAKVPDDNFDITTAMPRVSNSASQNESQIVFYLHRNPQNKILHTRLVGEMNGFLMAATLATTAERTWGNFGEPRAYSAYVQATPFVFSPGAP